MVSLTPSIKFKCNKSRSLQSGRFFVITLDFHFKRDPTILPPKQQQLHSWVLNGLIRFKFWAGVAFRVPFRLEIHTWMSLFNLFWLSNLKFTILNCSWCWYRNTIIKVIFLIFMLKERKLCDRKLSFSVFKDLYDQKYIFFTIFCHTFETTALKLCK